MGIIQGIITKPCSTYSHSSTSSGCPAAPGAGSGLIQFSPSLCRFRGGFGLISAQIVRVGGKFPLTPRFSAVFLLNPDPLGVGMPGEAAEEWQELGLFAQKGKNQQEFGRLEGKVAKERRNLGKYSLGEAGLARLPPSNAGFEEN